MRVVNLKIDKRDTYDKDYPGQTVGVVQIVGENGKMEVKLSSKTVSNIFNLTKDDVQKVAKSNAEQAGDAVTEAAENVKLLEQNKEDGIPF